MGLTEVVKKTIFVFAGTLFLAIGFIGILIPILPTTPLILLAAACYLKGSERLHHWIIENKIFGEFIRNYIEGKGVKPKQKAITLTFLWTTILLTSLYLTGNITVRILLFIIATTVSIHIIILPNA